MEKKVKFGIDILVNWESLFTCLENTNLDSEALVGYSILNSEQVTDSKIYDTISNFNKSRLKGNHELDRAIGSLMGLAIGDSLGHLLEFSQLDYKRKVVKDFAQKYYDGSMKDIVNAGKLKAGQWTDDTSQALCLADTLIECKGLDNIDFRKRLTLWWHLGYNNGFRFDSTRSSRSSVGRGQYTRCAMNEFVKNKGSTKYTTEGDEKSNSNGSLMRLAPIPIFYHHDVALAVKNAGEQSLTTHKGLDAADACRLLAFLIVKALHYPKIAKSAREFLSQIDMTEVQPLLQTETAKAISLSQQEKTFEKDSLNEVLEDRNWNWKAEDFKYSKTRAERQVGTVGAYAADALAMALHCLYVTKTLEECLLKITNYGGDSDTVGAIAGQLGGAIYGISALNQKWIQNVLQWDGRGEIAMKAIMLYSKQDIREITKILI